MVKVLHRHPVELIDFDTFFWGEEEVVQLLF